MQTPADLIAALGGTRAVADATDKPFTTVASWAARQSIPVEVWPALISLSKARPGATLTYEEIVEAHTSGEPAEKPRRRRKAA